MSDHKFGPLRLIVNPRAGSGGVGEAATRLTAALAEHGLAYDVVETAGPADAEQLTRTALAEGVRYLVAVGGDGTVHGVVNGMFDGGEAIAPDAVLAVFGAGSGADFPRTFGLGRPAEWTAAHLATEETMAIDVGVARFQGRDGRPAERLFANIAQVGYGAEVLRVAGRLPRSLGRARYLLAAWAGIRAVRRQEGTIKVSFGSTTVPVTDLVVANGQFFGGGMKVAPRALPDDGKFNVLAFTGNRSQMFMLTTQLYAGDHLPHPQIVEYQSPTVAFAPDLPMLVEADGELLGTTPVDFSLLPKALRLKL